MTRTNSISNIYFGLFLLLTIATIGCRPKEGSPEAIDVAIQKGNAAMSEKNWGEAAAAFSEILATSPDNIDALYRRAASYLADGKDHYNLAEAALTRDDQPTAEEEAAKADALFQKAKDDCAAALKIDSRSFDLRYILGCVHIYQGQWNDAIEEFSQCVKIAPENPLAYQRRGEVYGYIGDNMNETVDLKQAAKLGYQE